MLAGGVPSIFNWYQIILRVDRARRVSAAHGCHLFCSRSRTWCLSAASLTPFHCITTHPLQQCLLVCQTESHRKFIFSCLCEVWSLLQFWGQRLRSWLMYSCWLWLGCWQCAQYLEDSQFTTWYWRQYKGLERCFLYHWVSSAFCCLVA